MPNEGQRPLHRLTPLLEDPAAAWLSTAGRWRVGLTGVLGWGSFIVGMIALKIAISIFLYTHPVLFFVPRRATYVAIGLLIVALRPAVRRAILRRKSVRIAASIRQSASAGALTIDDWAELENAPEDQPISVVGWAHARQRLPNPVAGEPCIGLALPCQHIYPGVLETLHDFDLVDETGRSIPIQVADARMLGEPTVDLGGGDSQHVLIASLDLPAGANPSGWHAFVLRDGDPLLIVGFRKSMVDPNEHGLRQAPARAGVASSPPRPLLIFPIDAERRVSSGWG
ncbi:MAG TPA: hypothetical protein VIK30_14490 [Polyangia bacterium]